MRLVIECHAMVGPDSGTDADQRLGRSRDDPWAGLNGHDPVHGFGAVTQWLRKDAAELGDGAFGCRSECRKPQLTQRAQAERQRERFLIGEHHRRQTKTALEPVCAAHPARGFHRNGKILQARDVALHGARVDFEACGKLRAAHLFPGLQDLQHREHSHDGVVHEIYGGMNLRQRLSGITIRLAA